MKRIFDIFKRNWTRVWLIAIATAICTFAGFAAYTEVSSVKRVVSIKDSPGLPFSSNCMKISLMSRKLTSSNKCPVSVCNFDQEYSLIPSTVAITYDLTAELKIKISENGTTSYKTMSELADMVTAGTFPADKFGSYKAKVQKYSIIKTDDNGQQVSDSSERYFYSGSGDSISFNNVTYTGETLPANVSAADWFTVTIDSEDLENDANFFIYLTATPSDESFSSLKARLYGTKADIEEGALWKGSIVENNENDNDNKTYDFYNYVVSGSGAGTLEILWDPAEISVNEFFLIENSLTVSEVTENGTVWKKITLFNDNSQNVKNRYEFQIYKTKADSKILSAPDSCIKCRFTPKQTAEQGGQQNGE